MVNIYDFINSNASLFDQIQFGRNDDIFIDYFCPIQKEKAHAWCHKNCLMYVVHGVKGYTAQDLYHLSSKRQVLFIRKGGVVLHQFFEEPYRALIFMFDDSAILELISEYPWLFKSEEESYVDIDNFRVINELASNKHIEHIFKSALDYLKNPAPESTISMEMKFKELIVNILREKEGNIFASYLTWICHDTETAFIKLMKQNMVNNFSVKELARISCMSLSTFKREFGRIFGMAPGKWMSMQRLNRSSHLLLHTDQTVGEIAFNLGYNDSSAFSNWFKRQTGRSPAEYRQYRQEHSG